MTPLFRGAPRLGLALGPAPARAGPGCSYACTLVMSFDEKTLGKISTKYLLKVSRAISGGSMGAVWGNCPPNICGTPLP